MRSLPSSDCSFEIVSFFFVAILPPPFSLSLACGKIYAGNEMNNELGGRDSEYLESSTTIPGIGTIRPRNSAKGTRVTILLTSSQPTG